MNKYEILRITSNDEECYAIFQVGENGKRKLVYTNTGVEVTYEEIYSERTIELLKNLLETQSKAKGIEGLLMVDLKRPSE